MKAMLRKIHPLVLRQKWEWRSLRLDPERLPLPIAAPTENDFIIAGCPRTGTSLLAAALFQAPECVTLVEPWAGMRLAPRELFQHLRDEMRSSGELSVGTLDFDALKSGRVVRCKEGTSSTPVQLRETSLVGVKWPSYFQYLPKLPSTKFVLCLRHPFQVLRSMAALNGGLRNGQDYNLPFNRRTNRAIRERAVDPALRRIELFDYVHERLSPFLEAENTFVVRYERWFSDPDVLLTELSDFLGVRLQKPPIELKASKLIALTPDERALVLQHSRMAHRLDYDLRAQ